MNPIPRVVIDARMIGPTPHGIARYVCSIAQGLEQIKEKEGSLPYEPVFLINLGPKAQEFKGRENLGSFSVYPVKSPFLSPKELFEIPKALKNLKASLYHSPSFASLRKCPCPSIVTIHDLNHLTYGNLKQKLYYQILLRRFSKKSKAILTVSEFSKKEIARWLSIPLQRIEVIYNAIQRLPEPECTASPKDAHGGKDSSQNILRELELTPQRYFFSLSNSKPHKNLVTLIEAYQIFRKQQKNAWPLVLTVKKEDVTASSLLGVKFTGGLSSSEVQVLLKNSSGMFFPSLYEGFGLPPVEAAIAGVPLAISKIPPHQEGLQDLAPHEVLWIEPKDLHGWVNAFHKIAKTEVSPPSLAHQNKLIERFSIEKIGHRMDQVYRRVLRLI